MRAVRILVATVAMLLASGGVLAAPASAQSSNASPCAPGGPAANQYPPQDCGVRANQTSVPPGGKLTLTGECPAGTDSVNFRLQPGNADLGSATPNPQGQYSAQVTIPSDTAPGDYTIVATCQGVAGNGVTRSVAIKVAAAQAAALPRTGASVLPIGAGGLALLAVGAVAVIVTRKKRTAG